MINKRIKELRESLHLSQEAFGKSIGLSKSGISNIEKGIRTVRSSYIELICSKYNVSKEWLLTGDELAKEVHSLESFIDYLKSLEYSVNCIPYSENNCVFELQFNGISAIFTQEEFTLLQQQSKATIDGAILLQSQRNKKEPPPGSSGSGSESN